MTVRDYELSVCVNGRPIREYGHRGLTFIEGRENQPYTIRFKNNTACRVLAIISVDAISVVDGQPATAESRGYVVQAYASIEVKGWRTSNEKVNDFIFEKKNGAYSTVMQGEDINCGIVSAKVFSERFTLDLSFLKKKEVHHHHHHHHENDGYWPGPLPFSPPIMYGTSVCAGSNSSMLRTLTANSAGPAVDKTVTKAEPTFSCCIPNPLAPTGLAEALQAKKSLQEFPDFNLGTGWGEERVDVVESVKFERGGEICELSVYYADEAGMTKAGIVVDKRPAISKPVLPKGFNGFCVPPKLVR